MALADIMAADRRLCVLRFLFEDRDYTLNDSLLQEALQLVGHALSRDQLRGELAWLAEQGLLTTRNQDLGGKTITLAELSERGADVACGRATHPGVKRPAPGAANRGDGRG